MRQCLCCKANHRGLASSHRGALSSLSDSREPVAAKLLKSQVISALNFSVSGQNPSTLVTMWSPRINAEILQASVWSCHCGVCRRFLGWEHHKVGWEVVRLHTNVRQSLVETDAGIHPLSCSHRVLTLGPYPCRSQAHGPFWKERQEWGFSRAVLERSWRA